MKIYERITEYTISAVPENLCDDAYVWDLRVEYRGKDRWAILKHSMCLGSDGLWDYERQPSSRTDDWLQTHRFTLERALELAHQAAPIVKVNNITPADLLEKYGNPEIA